MTAPPDDAVVISRSLTYPAHFAIVFDMAGSARSQLRDQRTGDWVIEADQIELDRRCHDVSEIVPSTRTIVLIGTPGEHSVRL